jgi:hypothetical protein
MSMKNNIYTIYAYMYMCMHTYTTPNTYIYIHTYEGESNEKLTNFFHSLFIADMFGTGAHSRFSIFFFALLRFSFDSPSYIHTYTHTDTHAH